MSKSKNDKRLSSERTLAAAISDKMDALAHAQFCKARVNPEKHQRNDYAEMSSAERRAARRLKAQLIRNEVDILLRSCGLQPHRHNPNIPKATPEESMAIRMDFDAILHRPDIKLLSLPYMSAKQEWLQYMEEYKENSEPLYNTGEYNLNDSSIWKKLQKFNNFRQTRKKIVYQLRKKSIPPEAVATMNFYDFIDTLVDHSKETNSRPFESHRSKNLKMFVTCYEEDFTRVMSALRYKNNDIKEMLDLMRQGKSPTILDFHHHTNVANFRELEKPDEINNFSNMLLTIVHPYHHSLHFNRGYDLKKSIVFFGGFDPAYQIRRNSEKERQYLIKTGQINNNAKSR